jgi:enoyl-CoA hydratase/carnithine racemase
MSYKNILLKKGVVAELIMNRPEARNSLNGPHMRDIVAGLCELEADPTVRVIVMKGAGHGFSAGADISQLVGKKVYEAREHLKGVADIIETIAKTGKPVIAQVHGFALAGGLGVAVSCDITYVAEDAALGTPEVNIGLWPHTIMAPIFRAIGRKKGIEMMFTGDRIDAKEAERYGLITRAVPSDQLEAAVSELATKLAEKSPSALKIGKEAYYTMTDMEYFKSLHYLREMITLHSMTEDGQEGPRSFMDTRAPRWSGM